jgi:serine/threonine protein kinase
MIELADYSISQCLHEGSETAVYSGLRRRDNLPVVVKMPRDDHPLPTVLNRLRHEYALLREYAQPGVVQGLELVRSPSSLALVLEYVEGEPLTALVRSRKLDLALVLRIGLELAQILTRLHDRHVVHKDLKPHKISAPLTRRVDRHLGALRTCCG